MRTVGWRKIALGTLGTLLLGALGSGLWELALRPGGQWLGRAFLSLVTFGSRYLKDQVYIEAARGYHEASATESYLLLIVLMSWICMGLSVLTFQTVKWADRTLRDLERKQGAEDPEELREELEHLGVEIRT